MITKQSLMDLRLDKDWRTKRETLPGPEEVMDWFRVLEAGWVYDWGSGKPHAILHSGKHSNGFFLCKRVLSFGNLREILAACLIREMSDQTGGMGPIHGVFGSAYSSILLAGDVGRLLGVKTYVPEKDPTDPDGKRMRFKPDDPAPAGSVLLQIEELVTTWDSGAATALAVKEGNPNPVTFYPLVGVLIWRPPVMDTRKLPDGREIVAFIEKLVGAYEPAECLMCEEGSKAVLPKSNWAELTA